MVTPFYEKLKTEIPNLTGSEYLSPSIDSGSIVNGILNEDSTNLSFKDNSFDLYISNDVFEHVFDYKKAFSEAARVLKPKGKMIFHVPFNLGLTKTVIRAKKGRKGKIINILEPIYHGNPLSEEGSLCVQDFGWDLFDILRECGFKKSYALSKNNMYHGYLNVTSLVFIAEKKDISVTDFNLFKHISGSNYDFKKRIRNKLVFKEKGNTKLINQNKDIKIIRFLSKFIPKSIKNLLKDTITWAYNLYKHP